MADDVVAGATPTVAAKKPARGARRPTVTAPAVGMEAAASPASVAEQPAADLPVDPAAGQPAPPTDLTADPAIDVAPEPGAVSEPARDTPAPTIEPEPAAVPEAQSTVAKEDVMTDTATAFAAKAQDDARTAFANVGEQTRTAVEKSRKVAEDMAEFGKGNVEALVEASRIAAQGFEALGHDFAAFARERYDSAATAVQSMASVKSPTELAQLQADYFRSAFDALVKETSRSTEATLKLAGDVAKPLQNRFAIAADKFKVAA